MSRWSSGTWIGGLALALLLSLTAGAVAQVDAGVEETPDGSTTAEVEMTVPDVGAPDAGAAVDNAGAAVEGAAVKAADAVTSDPPEAEAAVPAVSEGVYYANNVWMMLCAALVFIMHLGFGTLEAGLTRSKNTVNILCKNTMVICIGILLYAVCGFNLMYPGFADGAEGNQYLSFAGLWLNPGDTGQSIFYHDGTYTYYTDFLFQAMFAATAATIVSGAVAERIKLGPFLVFATMLLAFSYPITGAWKWGAGFLDDMGFYDFAGSTVVHAVGGAAALAVVILLGPRLNKYGPNGEVNPIPGHSMPLAFIGVIMLWLGWFGFNGGSVLSADPAATSLVLVTTSIAAAAGAVAAYFVTRVLGKPDLSMILNGILAGLVGITAGADQMNPAEAAIIGLIAGTIVVFAVIGFDKIKIDDPVGALSVHLVCGIFGTLVVGIFGARGFFRIGGGELDPENSGSFVTQLIGCAAIVAFTFAFSFIVAAIIKATMGLRVSEEEEIEGLDLGEHDMAAYPDFQQTYIKSYHAREI